MVKPITPAEAEKGRIQNIPEEVIECFNTIIQEKIDAYGTAHFLQKEVVSLITKRMKVKSTKVYESGWLDVEKLFRAAGWDVTYDSPAYCESYEANFTFRTRR